MRRARARHKRRRSAFARQRLCCPPCTVRIPRGDGAAQWHICTSKRCDLPLLGHGGGRGGGRRNKLPREIREQGEIVLRRDPSARGPHPSALCALASTLTQELGAVGAVPLDGGAGNHARGLDGVWWWWRERREQREGSLGRLSLAAMAPRDCARPDRRARPDLGPRQATHAETHDGAVSGHHKGAAERGEGGAVVLCALSRARTLAPAGRAAARRALFEERAKAIVTSEWLRSPFQGAGEE